MTWDDEYQREQRADADMGPQPTNVDVEPLHIAADVRAQIAALEQERDRINRELCKAYYTLGGLKEESHEHQSNRS